MKVRKPWLFVLAIAAALALAPWAHAQVELVIRMPAAPPENPTLLDELFAMFEAQHPGIKITHIAGGANITQLLTQIAGNVAPDVATIGPDDAQAVYRQGIAEDLTPYMVRDNFDTSILPPSVEYMMYNGRWYGVPQAGGAFADRAIYVNRDMFSVAGLPSPTERWTWDEFRSMAEKLTVDRNGDGVTDQFGFSFEAIDWPIFVWSNGGDIFDADRTRFTMTDQPAVGALDWLADMVYRGIAKTAPPVNFPTGNVAMRTGAYFQAENFVRSNLNFDWTIVEFPRGVAGSVNRRTTHPFIIPASAKNKEAAWAFLKFWLSDEVQRRLVIEWRWRPPQTAPIAREMATMRLDGPPYTYVPFMGLTSTSNPLPVDVPKWPEINGILNSAITGIWNGTEPPRIAMERIAPQVMQLLAEGR